jgi:hypothetical protein
VPDVSATPERVLIAAVSRWAHENGWERGVLAEWYHSADGLIDVSWGFGTRGSLSIAIRETCFGPYLVDVDIPGVASVQRAVDVLVAFGVLPPVFSSAYSAGFGAAVNVGEHLRNFHPEVMKS